MRLAVLLLANNHFITVLVLILVAFVVEFISIAYEARKSFINREIVEITYDD